MFQKKKKKKREISFMAYIIDNPKMSRILKAPFSSRKFSTLSKIQNMKNFTVF